MLNNLLLNIFNYLILIINDMGYIGIFLGMMIESTIFPLPSELILIPAGALIARGEMVFSLVFIAAVTGTIIGAMIFGASRVVATEFSFFLAIPTIFAASVYSLFKYNALLNLQQIFVLSIGFIVSFTVALAVIKFFINYIQKNNFKIFGYYRIVLGIIIIAYFLIK